MKTVDAQKRLSCSRKRRANTKSTVGERRKTRPVDTKYIVKETGFKCPPSAVCKSPSQNMSVGLSTAQRKSCRTPDMPQPIRDSRTCVFKPQRPTTSLAVAFPYGALAFWTTRLSHKARPICSRVASLVYPWLSIAALWAKMVSALDMATKTDTQTKPTTDPKSNYLPASGEVVAHAAYP